MVHSAVDGRGLGYLQSGSVVTNAVACFQVEVFCVSLVIIQLWEFWAMWSVYVSFVRNCQDTLKVVVPFHTVMHVMRVPFAPETPGVFILAILVSVLWYPAWI